MKTEILISLILLLGTNQASASGAVAGATEITQLLNNAELVSVVSNGATEIAKLSKMLNEEIVQTTKAIEEVQNQIKDLTGYDDIMAVWSNVEGAITKMNGLINRGQAIAYTLENVDEAFKQRFPGFGNPNNLVNYANKYKTWSTSTLDGISSTLKYANLQLEDFSNETKALTKIRNLSQSADGTVKVVQAANMIAEQQVEQLQKLRVMQMEQFSAQANYMASQQKTKDSETEAVQKFLQQGKGHIRTDEEDGFITF